ncbi:MULTISPECIES: GMC family oxidoreductase [unclassified Arcicella]|uniref:GMC family oxidoreductase n=1 Tax=unclassified Arcicella TaxID=2644986 RepID=UPI00286714E0|nr:MULTISPECIES: GMC family oxidoreductase [unclassified Arcicella]MDR6560539.1 choline dehydrogenase-like flavoprotein [Arcicella sp. BE51]MDR6809855.1 choline dehydrogenase-like flavoprotein [Arcicella sp. BE140]MDR6821204.1 choline dehydrogenase-like flavoprotein [Arcicella sp. BE139]
MSNLNIDAVKGMTYDAIVIGSGVSGGWAAKELTEKGLRVLMLERGKQLEHVTGYENAMKDPWEMKYNGRLTIEQKESHPKLSRDYPYNEMTEKYWMNDSDSLYKEEKRFDWYRPNIVGGKSIMWGRQSYRLSDIDFEANLKDGIAVDWPIRYKDIAPWYSYVEKYAGISGEKLGLPQLPDGEFLPAMEMFCVEKEVKQRLEKNFPGRNLTMGRVANLSAAAKEQLGIGRSSCQYRNKCSLGCPFGAYFSTQSCTLPPAAKTGRLTLRPDSIVTEIMYDENKKKATGVRVRDAVTMQDREYFAKIIFVCGSTIGSTSLMMNSVSNRFPEGMGNDSGQLGHNLMDHHFRTGASGTWEGDLDKYYYGRRANGIYIPRYRNIGSDKRDYLRGFGYQGGGSRQGWQRNVAELSFGADYKNEVTQPGAWSMGFSGFGETLPYYENRMFLDKTTKDKWGLPVVVFDADLRENEKKMRIDMMNDAKEMLESSGVKNVKTYDNGSYLGMAIHEMGTARMGRDPKTSVLNAHNQVHAVKNVFMTDGAAMTSASCVNPSLTYMALTARAADFAVKELKKLNL